MNDPKNPAAESPKTSRPRPAKCEMCGEPADSSIPGLCLECDEYCSSYGEENPLWGVDPSEISHRLAEAQKLKAARHAHSS